MRVDWLHQARVEWLPPLNPVASALADAREAHAELGVECHQEGRESQREAQDGKVCDGGEGHRRRDVVARRPVHAQDCHVDEHRRGEHQPGIEPKLMQATGYIRNKSPSIVPRQELARQLYSP
eukprot:scaffold260_cov328-Prasinococcus_capsulatus_cf.AAC.13